jgi:hypothetical protein
MRKLVWFMRVSLDGFVAGPKREMDWVHVEDEIFEYAGRRTMEADAALYGRTTLAGRAGVEPATLGFEDRCSIH